MTLSTIMPLLITALSAATSQIIAWLSIDQLGALFIHWFGLWRLERESSLDRKFFLLLVRPWDSILIQFAGRGLSVSISERSLASLSFFSPCLSHYRRSTCVAPLCDMLIINRQDMVVRFYRSAFIYVDVEYQHQSLALVLQSTDHGNTADWIMKPLVSSKCTAPYISISLLDSAITIKTPPPTSRWIEEIQDSRPPKKKDSMTVHYAIYILCCQPFKTVLIGNYFGSERKEEKK